MKPNTGTLLTYLNSIRGQPWKLMMADAYTFTMTDGDVYCFTDVEVSFSFNGNLYLGNSILIAGLKYKATRSLDVDTQEVTAAARSTDTIGAIPFLVALASTLFDGCVVQRDRVVFSDRLGGTQVGSVTLFKGRVGEIKQVGRTSARFEVNSDLTLLDVQMARNLFQATCLHVLYDSQCGLAEADFATTGAVGAGSTRNLVNWSGAVKAMAQGRIVFTSGANAGFSTTMSTAIAGTSLALRFPLPVAPNEGDAFTAYLGCDHTAATCQSVFNNLVNRRAFDYVPPPEMAM